MTLLHKASITVMVITIRPGKVYVKERNSVGFHTD